MIRKPQMKSLAFLLLVLVQIGGCDPSEWRQLASQLQDTDGDGWFDENKNQRTALIVDSIDVPGTVSVISLVIDDRIILDQARTYSRTTIRRKLLPRDAMRANGLSVIRSITKRE
jgi:hypothetical protein